MGPILEAYSDMLTISDFAQVAKMLNSIRCDLLIIDASTLKDQTLSAVKEFKRNFPHRAVGVLLESTDDPVEDLLSVGTDLILDPRLSPEELHQQIRIVLNQNMSRRAIVADIEKLHVVSSLPVLLRELTNTEQIYVQAIKIIINLLNLEAVTILVGSGDIYRATMIKKPLFNAAQLTTATIPSNRDNPILWSIRHEVIQVYEDISLNPHFELSDGLNAHSPAVIVPFAYPGNQQGALAFFLPPGTPVLSPDTFIYEQFVAQLDSILLRAYQNETQSRSLLLNTHLIEAWSAFAEPLNFQEVLSLLSSVLSDIKGVTRILVSCQNPHSQDEYLVDNYNGELIRTIRLLNLPRILEEFRRELSHRSKPALIDLRSIGVGQAEQLSQNFGSNQFIVMPILVSDDYLGLILIAIAPDYSLDALEMHLLENLTYIAFNALQRITLRNIGLQNHKELMSILHSIREGIFYVDSSQKVTFCNPQFTELTSIPIANHIGQSVDELLRALSAASYVPTETYNQFQAARQQLAVSDAEQSYPIVPVLLWERNIDLSIEFVAIDREDAQPTWMGVAHSVEPAHSHSALESSIERVRAAHERLKHAIDTIAENKGQHTYNEHNELLENLRVNATLAGNRWEEFESTYQRYFYGASDPSQSSKLHNLLQSALADSRLSRETSAIKVNFPAPTLMVTVDKARFLHAFSHLLSYIVNSLPSFTPIEISTEEQTDTADVVISSTAYGPFSAVIGMIEQSSDKGIERQVNSDLLNAMEIIRRSGAQLSVQQSVNSSKILRIAIPLASPLAQSLEGSWQRVSTSGAANRALESGPHAIMLIEGPSTLTKRLKNLLEVDEFRLHRFQSGRDAILNLRSDHFELVILDQYLEGENALIVCREIRKQTTIPILMIADKISNQERARAIQSGADHLVTAATSSKELLDTIRMIVDPNSTVADPDSLVLGDLYVDFASRAVYLKNVLIELTRIEFDVLRTLIVNRGQTVTHQQLLTEVWGPGYEAESQYLWVSISRLRKKLEVGPDAPRYIRTQSGIGYYFAVQ